MVLIPRSLYETNYSNQDPDQTAGHQHVGRDLGVAHLMAVSAIVPGLRSTDLRLNIWSAWANMNQTQYAVTTIMMVEKTNFAKRSCVI
jgi:hypothetical protein